MDVIKVANQRPYGLAVAYGDLWPDKRERPIKIRVEYLERSRSGKRSDLGRVELALP